MLILNAHCFISDARISDQALTTLSENIPSVRIAVGIDEFVLVDERVGLECCIRKAMTRLASLVDEKGTRPRVGCDCIARVRDAVAKSPLKLWPLRMPLHPVNERILGFNR